MKFDFDDGLKFCQQLGVQALELAATGPSARKYCDVERLLGSAAERERWLDAIRGYGMEIYSFSGHGTPLVPDHALKAEYQREFRRACELMEQLGVSRMALVAGLPEGRAGDTM